MPDYCDPYCETGPAPWTPESPVTELPNTGVDVGSSVLVGVLLFVAGVVVLVRRRFA